MAYSDKPARLFSLLCMFFIIIQPFASAAKPFFAEKDIFISGEEGYDTYRIPAVIVSPRGILLAFCEGRNGDDPLKTGNRDTLLKRSFDNGVTWQPLQVVLDDGPNTCGNPCPVVDRDTGIIWLFLTRNLGVDIEGKIWDGSSKNTRTAWVMKSTDDGATWSQLKDITKSVKKPNWTWYATGPGIGIQLSNGRLIIPCNHGIEVTKNNFSHIIFSDDHGSSWQLGGIVNDPMTNECQVIEKNDRTLLLNMRNRSDDTFLRTIAVSGDNGLTWSATYDDSTLIDPHCQASPIRYTDEKNHDKNRLLFSNVASTTNREKVTVRLSYDEGMSWPISKLICSGPSAYSCLVSLPDKTIACLYECGEEKLYEKITYAYFNLEWLTDGNDAVQK